MRERKYKAWVKDRCEFFPVFEIDFYDKSVGVWGCGNENCGTCSDYFYFDEIELIEYTGLKDKNGVEIYEGDIIEQQHYFKNDDGTLDEFFKQKKVVGDIRKAIFGLLDVLENITVIGNIYENPELLKEDTE